MAKARKTKGGRPPAGVSGQKVTDYPHRLSTHIDSNTYHRLEMAARLAPGHRTHRELLTAAVAYYVENALDKETRGAVESAATAAARSCPICHRQR